MYIWYGVFFQAEDGIRDLVRSRGLGDVYKRQEEMSEISRVALFGKLNSVAYKAIEGATVFCKLRGNPYVELEHWVMQIVQSQDTDWHRVIKHFGLDVAVLAKDITLALDLSLIHI